MPSEQFFQLYQGKNKIYIWFDEVMMMSALYYTYMFSWIFIVLAYWNNSLRVRHVAPHGYIILIQSLLFLLIAMCLAEKQQIPIL